MLFVVRLIVKEYEHLKTEKEKEEKKKKKEEKEKEKEKEKCEDISRRKGVANYQLTNYTFQ